MYKIDLKTYTWAPKLTKSFISSLAPSSQKEILYETSGQRYKKTSSVKQYLEKGCIHEKNIYLKTLGADHCVGHLHEVEEFV
jgi:hypothetical protein